MTRRAKAKQRKPAPATTPAASPPPPPSGRRRLLFTIITLSLPFLLLGGLELGLRLVRYGDDGSLFYSPPWLRGHWLMVRPDAARRFFPDPDLPAPTPPHDVFLATKPANGLRIFALGESSTAGFPFPANGTFSRVLQDALQDVLPDAHVEVVNLGIPAISSYALLSQVDAVLAQQPDAVLIYTGHNEYYGALGAGSSIRIAGSPALVRLYLSLLRFRTVQLLERGLRWARSRLPNRQPTTSDPAASRMELMVKDRDIPFDGPVYRRGLAQFEANLGRIIARYRQAGVPVFVASLASNLRDQPPFGSDSTGPAARALFDSASTLLARGDSVQARALFERARDLDVVRFRAPGAFNAIIRRLAARFGATYVPVAEAFDSVARYRIPGSDLFYEHVHPTQHGYALIGRAFFDALAAQGFLGRRADLTRLDSWDGYERRMYLTGLDHRTADIVLHIIRARWPFVPPDHATDYLAHFRPANLTDSLALGIATAQINWAPAKARLGETLEAAGQREDALLEYRGIIREEPWHETPFRLAGKVLLDLGRADEAKAMLERAYLLEPTDFTCYALGMLAAQAGDMPRAVQLLQQSLRLRPDNPVVLYQLSLAYGLTRDAARARETALRLARIRPDFPGLKEWMKALGM